MRCQHIEAKNSTDVFTLGKQKIKLNNVKKKSLKNQIPRPSQLRMPQIQWAGKKRLLSIRNSSE